MTRGWFITGTDTGVGKTHIAQALLQALGRRGFAAVGMKPIASGCVRTPAGLRSDDAERLAAASTVPADYADINPYAFEPAIAPHIAAARAGVELRLEALGQHFRRLAARADWVVVEGAGGWDVPFDRGRTLSAVARAFGLPVILVVGVRLGCINHALLTGRAVRADGLRFAGWVANRIDAAFDSADESIADLDGRLGAPRLADVPYGADAAQWRECADALLANLLRERFS
ncbi:MAG: dethiobiotin synthase [Sulfurifustis sp.]